MILGAILCGFLVNGLRAKPLPLVREAEDLRLARSVSDSGIVKIAAEPSALTLDDMVSAFENGGSVFVDAREEAFYALGHIPNARNLPRSEFRPSYADFAGQVGKGTSLIIYCSDAECPDGLVVAKALIRLGYADARVFPGGWQEWSEAGLPMEP